MWSLRRHTDWGLRDYGVDGQLGLEPTPEEYLAKMVSVFREVRRVLRKDGSLWLNMGDSYGQNQGKGFDTNQDGGARKAKAATGKVKTGLKPKDLIGMPWRLALALQADGWWLRSEIIWHKRSAMPSSVRDRPSTAHEHIFLLTKAARYFYDEVAAREPHSEPWRGRGEHESSTPHSGRLDSKEQAAFTVSVRQYNPAGRNMRTVWSLAHEPFPDAHFATFPTELVRRCLSAGISEHGCCGECGAPWERVLMENEGYKEWAKTQRFYGDGGKGTAFRMAKTNSKWAPQRYTTTGWQPTCTCNTAATVPCTVLDPFAGSGTTLLVARRLGCRAIGIELSPQYAEMARRRIYEDAPLFNG